MNATIQAQVNPRLLSKANRLFTGSLHGRIIEILQNARRAGATEVRITNRKGQVTVQDNGKGIDDFEKLLDLGGSGWPLDEGLEQSEDPAGVGLFCLAPRKLTVKSNGIRAIIEGDGWTGAPVKLTPGSSPGSPGTCLQFEDEPWDMRVVEPLAVFTGMKVTVGKASCASKPFIQGQFVHDTDLGCRIQIMTFGDLSAWHRDAARLGAVGSTNVLVNFHGQTVGFNYRPVSESDLYYLVDLTGEPTGIRLMLPARTQLVENDAFEQLKRVLERQTYLYLQQLGRHRLPYEQYLRARELGIKLPEAEPVYQVGLLPTDVYGVNPVEVVKPENFELARCYRFDHAFSGDEQDQANVHLLAALGKFDKPLVPVDIASRYDGYAWAKLPVIRKVQVQAGKALQESWVWAGKLICVDSLKITAHANDGKVFSSDVCLAVRPYEQSRDNKHIYYNDDVYITLDARGRLSDTEIWRHLGGFSDEGDTWDTQESAFSRQMDEFWARLMGPDEPLRQRLVEATNDLEDNWRSITVLSSGTVTIHDKDGRVHVITPPKEGGAS